MSIIEEKKNVASDTNDQQGDVEKVIRTVDQEIVASYSYDAWGNILTATRTLADLNPIRYRGYYYDTETGFYYLQSRYYDPQTGRFINADGYVTTGQGLMSYNMFAYCLDNPVNQTDKSGRTSLNSSFLKADDGLLDDQNRARIRQIETRLAANNRLVFDVSVSVPIGAGATGKYGLSFVFDLTNEPIEVYFHHGRAISNASGIFGAFGLVKNYSGEGSYAGLFVDRNAGYIIGIDYCYSPDKPIQDAIQAISVTFPIAFIKIPWTTDGVLSPSYGYGIDNYYYFMSFKVYK